MTVQQTGGGVKVSAVFGVGQALDVPGILVVRPSDISISVHFVFGK